MIYKSTTLLLTNSYLLPGLLCLFYFLPLLLASPPAAGIGAVRQKFFDASLYFGALPPMAMLGCSACGFLLGGAWPLLLTQVVQAI
jgi:hypothetical protein